jgi:hypothetical protein
MKKIDLAVLAQEVAPTPISGLPPDTIIKWCAFSFELDKKRQEIVAFLEKIRQAEGAEAKEAEDKYLLEEADFTYNEFLSEAHLAHLASNSKWNTSIYLLLHKLIVIKQNEPIGDIQGQ